MKKSKSMNDLLMEELACLLSAENMLIEYLPQLAQASDSSGLSYILEKHVETSMSQARRLLDIFGNVQQNPMRIDCQSTKAFIVEAQAIIKKIGKGPSRDAAIISVARLIEQYEIDKYQEASDRAATLGHTEMVELLNKSIQEERLMNFYLNELAQYMINVQAISPNSSNRIKHVRSTKGL